MALTSALVGRERELNMLAKGLDGLATERGALFLLTGEAGIGKTRLADELSARARERGVTVAWGAAWDGGGAPAFWPWIQVLRALRPDEAETGFYDGASRRIGAMLVGRDVSRIRA